MTDYLRLAAPQIDRKGRETRISASLGTEQLWISIRAPEVLTEKLEPTLYPFLPVAIFKASLIAKNLVIESEIEDAWFNKLELVFKPLVSDIFGIAQYKVQKLNVGSLPPPQPSGIKKGDSALFFSGGIDSLYSRKVLRDRKINYQWLININAGAHAEYYDSWRKELKLVAQVAEQDDVSLVSIDTNFHKIIGLTHVKTHVIRNLSAALGLYPAITNFFYSSGDFLFRDISFQKAKTQIAALDHMVIFSMAPTNSTCIVIGSDTNRIDKLRSICEDQLVQNCLTVCANDRYREERGADEPANCGSCMKCIRTSIALDHFEKLNQFSNTFDLTGFDQQRRKYLNVLMNSKNHLDRKLAEAYIRKKSL